MPVRPLPPKELHRHTISDVDETVKVATFCWVETPNPDNEGVQTWSTIQMPPCSSRQPRYITSATTISQKCHGAFVGAVAAFAMSWVSTAELQVGHVPLSARPFGVKYLSQGSHQGTPTE